MNNNLPIKKKRRKKSHSFIKAIVMLALTALIITLTAYVARLTLEVGEAEPREQAIDVVGEATVSAEPDLAIVTISLETSDPKTANAQNKHSLQSERLIKTIKELAIPDSDIQTTNYSIYEDEKWDPETREYNSVGWIVNESWEIKIKDLSLVNQVLLKAGQNGATNINGPHFQLDDTDAAMQEAREKAIADARKNATKIADALGLKLGDVIDYAEWTAGSNQPYYAFAEAISDSRAAAPTPNIEPGQEELTMFVEITFRLR